MALKTERVIYSSKNFQAGLADVTANIRRNGSSVATNVPLSDIGSGFYELILTPANLTSYGGSGYYDFLIDSASKPAPARTARWILVNDSDDLASLISNVDSDIAALQADVDTLDTRTLDIQSKVTDNKTTLESGVYGLSALKTLIDSISSALSTVQNNTFFVANVPTASVVPSVGSTTYRIPITVNDASGNLEDPDSNQILVSITNQAGLDRTSRLAGYVSGPVAATRTALGQYYIDYTVANTEVVEQWNFKFEYTENSLGQVHFRTSRLEDEAQASGSALETTSQDILADTADMQPRVLDIQNKVNSATFGLAAIKDLIDDVIGFVDSVEGELGNGTYGLSALQALISGKASQASVSAIDNKVTDVQGAGFVSSTDSLKAISDRVYTGGTAI